MTQTLNPQHTAHPAFQASPQLGGHLQQLLVDLTDLHLQGKQLHWNVVGKNFRDTHLVLDEVVDAAREFSDVVAERMRAVYVTPDARSKTVAATTSLPDLPTEEIDTADTVDAIVASLYATAGTTRRIHDEVDAEDPTTADILHTILERLEQLAWMIDAENRVANNSIPRSHV
ncbi:DNA starvation/stationary phase protection protein [Nocardioides szechwanensis]|uniref:Starvation-inducible DNA-binding protein n=1 Tax=Nocardioides szechwanensis TaxID=1005944 RepID=A0A1G9UZK2_9ACTN|nr:DNA starvation/stationary phase protection protein [Nocardioides szechwanensis]GEP33087.1 DNA starvation/stationary phase protection protein [Nocardioides szechwanensis]SDM65328.1 starvation-inducible DNA-binding protein [Nocardioides szechwanensis]